MISNKICSSLVSQTFINYYYIYINLPSAVCCAVALSLLRLIYLHTDTHHVRTTKFEFHTHMHTQARTQRPRRN